MQIHCCTGEEASKYNISRSFRTGKETFKGEVKTSNLRPVSMGRNSMVFLNAITGEYLYAIRKIANKILGNTKNSFFVLERELINEFGEVATTQLWIADISIF